MDFLFGANTEEIAFTDFPRLGKEAFWMLLYYIDSKSNTHTHARMHNRKGTLLGLKTSDTLDCGSFLSVKTFKKKPAPFISWLFISYVLSLVFYFGSPRQQEAYFFFIEIWKTSEEGRTQNFLRYSPRKWISVPVCVCKIWHHSFVIKIDGPLLPLATWSSLIPKMLQRDTEKIQSTKNTLRACMRSLTTAPAFTRIPSSCFLTLLKLRQINSQWLQIVVEFQCRESPNQIFAVDCFSFLTLTFIAGPGARHSKSHLTWASPRVEITRHVLNAYD